MKKVVFSVTSFLIVSIVCQQSSAFTLSNVSWEESAIQIYYNLGDPQWNSAFDQAAYRWNKVGNFVFTAKEKASNPCSNDAINSVGMRSDHCGEAFGSSTLAITLNRYTVPDNRYTEVDITFNSNVDWQVYDGPLSTGMDVTRVAIHELGHALGLQHSSSPSSIMYPLIGDVHLPAQDDINGVNSRYVRAKYHRFDFNGDAMADLLWRNAVSGKNWQYLMNGNEIQDFNGLRINSDSDWQIAGIGDVNGDQQADIVWRNQITGYNWLWLMNGSQVITSTSLRANTNTEWYIATVADIDGDSKSDIIWRRRTNGQNWLWLMNGAEIRLSQALRSISVEQWDLVGASDLNGDKKADLLWRNKDFGGNWVWFMNGTTVQTSTAIRRMPDLNWEAIGFSDFNGDRRADILWRHRQTGLTWMWVMNGTEVMQTKSVRLLADQGWQVGAVADFDADGRSDIYWQHQSKGLGWMWFMEGRHIKRSVQAPAIKDTTWVLVN